MSSQDETFDGREQRLNAIIAEILEAREAGEKLSQEAILDRHPEFARELKEFFENEPIVRGSSQLDRQLPCFGDDFEDLEIIGRGGMGVVYKAHQKSLNKVVAIKTIEGPFATPSEVERIHDEAQRAARLRHPNIVTVHQVAEYEGRHFFVMDYMEGGSLADRIHDGPLSSAEAARYLNTLAHAVHYAHQRQVLHCDLKPANVLLDGARKLCVSDFGLARGLGEDGRYLPTSAVGGTAAYMAPEQAASVLDPSVREELTTATDIYGLGGVLYALLTGTTPFREATLKQTLGLVCQEQPQPPGERTPGVDENLEAICLRCLSKDRDARYGSADALAEDLARYQAGEETTARSWNRRERLVGWSRRNPAVAGLLAAVVGISMLTVVTALSIAQARKDALLAEALQSNRFEAGEQAAAALLQLRDWSDTTEVAADDPDLSDLLARGDGDGLQRYLEQRCGAFSPRALFRTRRASSCSVYGESDRIAPMKSPRRYSAGETTSRVPKRTPV